MTDQISPDVVSKSIIVQCSVEAAFRTWTEEITTWWPKSHSFSGDTDTEVFIEGKVGGRVYECASDGQEYDWGEILIWEPPDYLAYTWYFGTGSAQPTRVEVRFSAMGNHNTRVDLTHYGRDLIGDLWDTINVRFLSAWNHILPLYVTFSNKESTA